METQQHSPGKERLSVLPRLVDTIGEYQHGKPVAVNFQPDEFGKSVGEMNSPVWIHLSIHGKGLSEIPYSIGIKGIEPSEAESYLARVVKKYIEQPDLPCNFQEIPFFVIVQRRQEATRLTLQANLENGYNIQAIVSDHPLNFVQRTTFYDTQSIERLLT